MYHANGVLIVVRIDRLAFLVQNSFIQMDFFFYVMFKLPQCWLGQFTFTSVFDLALELHLWGLRPQLALIGASAGVDHIFSVVLTFRRYVHPFTFTYVVAIAGAYHPTLYDVAKGVFLKDRTNIIVHHHPKDTLCPFPPVAAYWEELRGQMRGHVFIHTLECHDRQL